MKILGMYKTNHLFLHWYRHFTPQKYNFEMISFRNFSLLFVTSQTPNSGYRLVTNLSHNQTMWIIQQVIKTNILKESRRRRKQGKKERQGANIDNGNIKPVEWRLRCFKNLHPLVLSLIKPIPLKQSRVILNLEC